MSGVPRAKRGELKAQWASTQENGKDIHYFRGPDIPKCDMHLLHNALSAKHYGPLDKEWRPSFLEELDRRGYDVTTLRISVQKKTPRPSGDLK